MTLAQALQWSASQLRRAEIRTPRQDAEQLLAYLLQESRSYLFAHPERTISGSELSRLEQLVERRSEHYPLQYLVGRQEFYGRNFLVTPAVLIPRPESELLIDMALPLIRPGETFRVLDVGTGSGCLAVTLAVEGPATSVLGLDSSWPALAIARENALRHDVSARTQWLQSDWLAALSDDHPDFELIVSNPPYVGSDQADEVDRSVRRYEPAQAVFAGPDPLHFYRLLFQTAPPLLAPQGQLLVELGYDVGAMVVALAAEAGWRVVRLEKDLSGIDRCLQLERSSSSEPEKYR